MTEELCEYLVRRGWRQDLADDAHDAYVETGVDGAVESIAWAMDEEHDYRDELRAAIEQWEEEVGNK